MSKKQNDLVKDLHQQIVSGKAVVHTKSKKELEADAKALAKKTRRAYVGAPIILTATLNKLEELQELGAVKMKSKMLTAQLIKSLESDLNKFFDNVEEEGTNTGSMVHDGAEYLEKGLNYYLDNFTDINDAVDE